ncbi:SdpI family protein [Microbacterium ureisolvens]|uniref:SdpI family protein n=1 Tax=Microbacterium ureisolvens TaxID=2781186 RepID=UPI003631CB27
MSEEIVARVILFPVMVGAGLLMLWLARAAASGRLGRNQLAGVRLPSTLASDKAWLAGHRAARRPTEIAGWCALASAAPALTPLPLPVVVGVVLLGALAMIAFTLWGAVLANRAALAV